MGFVPPVARADRSSPNARRSCLRCAIAPTPTVFARARTLASRAPTGRSTGWPQKQLSQYIRRVQHAVLSVAGLKGTMSEAELHIIRARLDGGIRNKAARGELRRGLPVGLVWGEQDGEVLFHPDEAVTGAIRTVFERFAEFGSARRVWLWFRSEGLSFPLQTTPAGMPGPIRWVTPTYHALHQILTNPVYAGAYTYGKTRYERR